ncbi:MAG: site-specific integrase [Duncaniella sp.]|nr:site-specific integrase [Duncaniella sp.]
MAGKKTLRGDNTYMIVNDNGDNPKLGAKMLCDGRESLFLDIYLGYAMRTSSDGNLYNKAIRRRESLKLYLWTAPRNKEERQHNKETIELAKQIRYERSQRLLHSVEGYRLRKDRNINFLSFFQSYIDGYTKKDVRVVAMALRRFKEFLSDRKEYETFAEYLRPNQLNREMVEQFVDFLKDKCRGEGAKTVFARFKKVVRYAEEQELIIKNPCRGLSIKVDDGVIKKDVLSMDEIRSLMTAHCPGENPDVRRAFLFSLYTGMRFCDVRDLRYSDVDYSNRMLRYEQNKTKGHSAASGVVVPLNDSLLRIIGEPGGKEPNEVVFRLPSHTMCLKALRNWVAKAGINKHITWHCARHSFALNILNNGANIKTVASLLGHSGLKNTEKYLRAVDSLKAAAINSLPEIEL